MGFPDERALWKNGITSEDGVFFSATRYRGVLHKELPCANCNDLYPKRDLACSAQKPRFSGQGPA